jgi:hypothetical protein
MSENGVFARRAILDANSRQRDGWGLQESHFVWSLGLVAGMVARIFWQIRHAFCPRVQGRFERRINTDRNVFFGESRSGLLSMSAGSHSGLYFCNIQSRASRRNP